MGSSPVVAIGVSRNFQLFLGVAEGLLAIEQRNLALGLHESGLRQRLPRVSGRDAANPGTGGGVASCDLISSSETIRPFSRSISSILPGCSRHLCDDHLLRHGQHAGLGGQDRRGRPR